MISLFDYLGRPAGPDLGKEVAEYAAIKKAKYGTRNVNTKKYQGTIMLYERTFLDEFFRNKNAKDIQEINSKLQEESFKQWEPVSVDLDMI